MTFSDEDFERLKKDIEIDTPTWIVTPQLLKALIGRLEAAEKALNLIKFDPDSTKEQIHSALEEWLLSAGK